jgi:hypothetical protein
MRREQMELTLTGSIQGELNFDSMPCSLSWRVLSSNIDVVVTAKTTRVIPTLAKLGRSLHILSSLLQSEPL